MRRRLSSFLILTACLLVAAVGTAGAQSDWDFGIKAGVNSSKLRGDQVSLFLNDIGLDVAGAIGDHQSGFVGGGFARRKMSENWALQFEALFTRKGGEGNIFGTFEVDQPNASPLPGEFNGQLKVELDYIEVPIIAVFNFPSDDKVTLTAQAGGAVSFATRAEVLLDGLATVRLPDLSTRSQTVEQKYDIGSSVTPVDISGVVGIGLDIARKKSTWHVEARWTFGLLTVDGSSGDKADVWNSAFSFIVGIGWPGGSS